MKSPANYTFLARVIWRRVIIAVCIALCFAYAYYIQFVPRRTLGLAERLIITAYLAVFFSALAYVGWGVVDKWLRAYSQRTRLLLYILSLGAGVLAVLVIPLYPPAEPSWHSIEIVATAQKNSQSQSNEVWLYGLTQNDVISIPFSLFSADAGWSVKGDALVAAGSQPATARWEGSLEPGAQLRLLEHPWSGVVNVTIDGQSQIIDLYSATATTRNVAIPAETGRASLSSQVRAILFYVAEAGCLATLALVILPFLVRSSKTKEASGATRWSWLAYALPCASVWLIYLLAFWPGMMSPDSLDQWGQAQSSHFIDHHPASHTMILWLVMHIWPSPAAMALLQILALAVVFGLTIYELTQWGVPSWVRIACTVLFALAPVNAAMTITLWKDVLYSIAMLSVFSVLLRVVRTQGKWLQSWRNCIVLALLLAAVALFRHNGLPLAVFVLAATFALFNAQRRRLGIVALFWLSVYVIVRLGIYNLVSVEPMSRAFSLYYSVHQVAAFVHNGAALSDQDKALLSGMQPLERWRDDYTCYGGDPTFWSKSFNHAFLQAHADEFTALWLRLIREHPKILVRHLFCINSLNWRIIPAADSYMYVVQNGIQHNTLGLEQHPLIPQLTPVLQQVLFWFNDTGQGWIWRPALYFYLTLAVIIICALRSGNAQILLLSTVSTGNIGVMMFLTPAQDLRYQYGVLMIGFIAPSLLWAISVPKPKPLMKISNFVKGAAVPQVDTSAPTPKPPFVQRKAK